MLVIHYHKDTGKISAWGSGDSETSHFADHLILRLEDHGAIDPTLHKVDPEQGCICEMTQSEKAAELRPLVDHAIRTALAASDQFIPNMWPEDRPPLSSEEIAAWKTYRKALRDLSKQHQNPADMLRAWPQHPHGHDTVGHLRTKLSKARL